MSVKIKEVKELVEKLEYEFEGIEEIDEGTDQLFAVKTLTKADIIIKFRDFEDLDESLFRKEPLMLEHLKKNVEIVTPKVLEYDFSEDRYPPYFVMEKLGGKALSEEKHNLSEKELEAICYEAGKLLGNIHSNFELDDFGWITEENGEMKLEKENWKEMFSSSMKDRIGQLEDTEFSGYVSRIEDYVEENLDRLNGLQKPVLGHDDYRPGNILVSETEIAGLVDWARAHSMDPAHDVVTSENHFVNEFEFSLNKENVKQSFRNGYNESNEYKKNGQEELYELKSLIGLMIGISKYWGNSVTDNEREIKKERFRKEMEEILY